MTAVTQFGETVSINALFVQPTILCGLNCSGCYVKGGFDQHVTTRYIDRSLLYDIVFNSNRKDYHFHVNQITFAVDVANPETDNGRELLRIFRDVWNYVVERRSRVDHADAPEFHLTMFNLQQMTLYAQNVITAPGQPIGAGDYGVTYAPFNLVSVSQLSIEDVDRLKLLANQRIKINWNYQPISGSVDKQVEKIKTILPHVESMYFIIHKPDIGYKLDPEIVKQYFAVWEALKKELPKELLNKIEIDGCVKDAKKFIDTGFGCSSNVSRFQVWPGGHVTGCPYKHTPTTGGASSMGELLANIREAKQTYEFNGCKIPNSLHPNHPRHIEDEHPYLRILD
jgi:hypothetical protein